MSNQFSSRPLLDEIKQNERKGRYWNTGVFSQMGDSAKNRENFEKMAPRSRRKRIHDSPKSAKKSKARKFNHSQGTNRGAWILFLFLGPNCTLIPMV